jgi:transcription termination/antitermination protein NusA
MDEIHLMNALSQIARVSAKDCLVEDNLISYFVREEDVGKAIGKNAANMKILQDKLKKRVEIIGYQENPEKVVSKALGIEVLNAKENGEKLVLNLDGANKRKAMTSGGKMKRVKKLIKRNYGKEIIFK